MAVDYHLGEMETKFADIVWENPGITTAQLVEACENAFSWKRTTTYTVLKKFENRGIFAKEDGVVKVLVTRDEFYAMQSEHYLERSFKGSLPHFLAAFTSRHKLTDAEIEEIEKIING